MRVKNLALLCSVLMLSSLTARTESDLEAYQHLGTPKDMNSLSILFAENMESAPHALVRILQVLAVENYDLFPRFSQQFMNRHPDWRVERRDIADTGPFARSADEEEKLIRQLRALVLSLFDQWSDLGPRDVRRHLSYLRPLSSIYEGVPFSEVDGAISTFSARVVSHILLEHLRSNPLLQVVPRSSLEILVNQHIKEVLGFKKRVLTLQFPYGSLRSSIGEPQAGVLVLGTDPFHIVRPYNDDSLEIFPTLHFKDVTLDAPAPQRGQLRSHRIEWQHPFHKKLPPGVEPLFRADLTFTVEKGIPPVRTPLRFSKFRFRRDRKISGIITLSTNLHDSAPTILNAYERYLSEKGFKLHKRVIEHADTYVLDSIASGETDYWIHEGHMLSGFGTLNILPESAILLEARNGIQSVKVLASNTLSQEGRFIAVEEIREAMEKREKNLGEVLVYVDSSCFSVARVGEIQRLVHSNLLYPIGATSLSRTFTNRSDQFLHLLQEALREGGSLMVLKEKMSTSSFNRNGDDFFAFGKFGNYSRETLTYRSVVTGPDQRPYFPDRVR